MNRLVRSSLALLLLGTGAALAEPPAPEAPPRVAPPPAPPRAAPRPPGSPAARSETKPATAPPAVEAPEACRAVTEKTAVLFEAVVQPLITEAGRREDASAEAGQTAFEAALAANAPAIAAARAEAQSVDAGLTADQRKACEDFAYRRFARAHARFAPAAGFFSGRGTIFRALGSAFGR